MVKFAAIDFETADFGRDSACALAIVRVHGSRIVGASSYLIRPPRRSFVFTYLHGISWEDVADKPTFGQLWPRIERDLAGVDFLVAHNASFDRIRAPSVLRTRRSRTSIAGLSLHRSSRPACMGDSSREAPRLLWPSRNPSASPRPRVRCRRMRPDLPRRAQERSGAPAPPRSQRPRRARG